MADDRPLEDPTDKIGRLQSELEDLRATLLARLTRRPTGDVETTIRTTPKANTLILNGAVVARSDYPDLWAWAQEQGLVVAGLFTVGNGTTTFGLPDFRGRVVRGVAASGEAIGALLGADSKTIAVANLPAHKHNVAVGDHDQHNHDFLTAQGGNHGGHFPGDSYLVPSGSSYGLAAWNSAGAASGTHNHSGTTAYEPISGHNVTEASVGSGTALDVRQASVAVNWLIWI